jgi:hypothetical protein
VRSLGSELILLPTLVVTCKDLKDLGTLTQAGGTITCGNHTVRSFSTIWCAAMTLQKDHVQSAHHGTDPDLQGQLVVNA